MSVEISKMRAQILMSIGEKVDAQSEAAVGRLRTAEGVQVGYRRAADCLVAHAEKVKESIVDAHGIDGAKPIVEEFRHAIGIVESLHDGANVARIKSLGAVDAIQRIAGIVAKEYASEMASIEKQIAYEAGEIKKRPPGAKPKPSRSKQRRAASKKKTEVDGGKGEQTPPTR